MKKQMSSKVEKLTDRELNSIYHVHHFIRGCIHELKLNFHPDTPFVDYVNKKNETLFTEREQEALERTLDRCFEICRTEKADIYGISLTEFNKPLVLRSRFKL